MSNLSGFIKRLRDIMRNDAGINGDAQRIEQIAWLLFLKVYATKEADWEWEDENYQSIIPEPCRWENWAAQKKRKRDDRGQAAGFCQQYPVPDVEKPAGGCRYPHPQGHCPDHLCRRQQLHEGRRPAAAGHQYH